jgi:hypothetical protein
VVRVKISADQCPRLTEAYLAGELRALGPMIFRQEFGCEFAATADNMFSIEVINRAFVKGLPTIW